MLGSGETTGRANVREVPKYRDERRVPPALFAPFYRGAYGCSDDGLATADFTNGTGFRDIP